ncbi:hypothetical protein AKI39_06210 [Bordetella sp. H567]|uniref:hypothetical protein n=1 Tax=Bordetella sp. H567 TaxID=1697043 RepID=UPI00081C512B|nr:hypothetical protein [Bordetella sp. H567]AOB30377.1 hypothetical protein AKI39_06210 [Bordetella sp. H567]
MKNSIRILVLGSCLLTGCMTSQQRFQQGLQTLHGQPLQMAMQRLGVPVGEENIAGMRVLVWSLNETRTDYVTQSTSASAGRYGGEKPKEYGAQFAITTPVVLHAHCTVKLHVDHDNIVRGSGYDGNIKTCRRYIHALYPDRSPLLLDLDLP